MTAGRGHLMNQRCFGSFIIAGTICLTAAAHGAEDVTTRSGKVLKKAEIVAIEGDQIIIRHAGRTEKFGPAEIPEPLQKRFRDHELKRKADEVEKLRQELARREAELRKLKDENERVAREPNPAAPTASRVVEKSSTPIEPLPAIKAGDTLDTKEIVLHYKTDSAAADHRYRKKTFQIKGVVERFEPKRFVRLYDVLLESPEKSVGLVCKFSYADRWKAVYTKEHGRLLVAREGQSEIRLLKAGDTVIVRARCEGLKGSDLEFSRCELVR